MSRPQPTNLHDAQQLIDDLVGANQQLTETVTDLQAQVAWLSRQLFGSKSERVIGDDKAGLFAHLASSEDGDGSADHAPPGESDTQTVSYERPATPARRGKRQPIPDDVPRIERVHDLPDDEKSDMKCIGREVSEELEHEPGKVYVIRHIRYTYARKEPSVEPTPEKPNVITAPKPVEGLPGCIAGPSLLAQIMVSKFADHLPLHRLEGIWKRHGIEIARSSMCRWAQQLDKMCTPLMRLMKNGVLQSHVIRVDESPVNQQQRGPGRRGARGRMKQCYFYCYVGDDNSGGPYTLFDYQTGRSRAGPNGWFTDERGEPNYHGYLQCDAYAGYNDLFDVAGPWRMIHAGCWAHTRRKFYDVRVQFPGPCHHALGQIKLLYEVEREANELDAEQRQSLRDEKSRPIVTSLLNWCEDQKQQVLPRSGLGEAITYTLNQAESLERFLDDGQLAIDNNMCERSLRGIALGRRNWLFTGSEAGGKAAATMFSLIASARRHDLEPWAYLTDVFRRLPATPVSQLDQFLPDRWQAPDA